VPRPWQVIPKRAGWRSAFASIAGFGGVLLTFLHLVNLALTVSGRVPVTPDLDLWRPEHPVCTFHVEPSQHPSLVHHGLTIFVPVGVLAACCAVHVDQGIDYRVIRFG